MVESGDGMRKFVTKKNMYLLALFIICLLGIVIVPTYAKFGSSYETTDDVVGLSLDFDLSITNIEEYKQLLIPAGESETFNVEVTNNTGSIVYYGIWYRMVLPETLTDDISIGKLSSSSVTTSGSIDSSGVVTVPVAIVNNGTEAIKVDIGVASSDSSTSDIEYLEGKYLVNETVLSVNEVDVGSYVVYSGNNGCEGAACSGQNANYVDDTDMGYCINSQYKFNVNGWRVAYIKDETAYLISAGAPECGGTYVSNKSATTSLKEFYDGVTDTIYYYDNSYNFDESTGVYSLSGNATQRSWVSTSASIAESTRYTCMNVDDSLATCTSLVEVDSIYDGYRALVYQYDSSYERTVGVPKHIANLDAQALKYCNEEFAYGGVCNSSSTWAMDDNDFEMITSLDFLSCRNILYDGMCGKGNSLIDNGGFYWFSSTFSTVYVGGETIIVDESTEYDAASAMALGVVWDDSSGVGDYYSASYTTVGNGIRPVIRLKSSIIVVSGSGTYEDPYVLAA